MDYAVDVRTLIEYAVCMSAHTPDPRINLTLRLVAAPGFRWDARMHRVWAATPGEYQVNLDDPSTRGILLDQARAAWGNPHLYVYYNPIRAVFCVGGGLPLPTTIEGPTEGDTLALLIIQAPTSERKP